MWYGIGIVIPTAATRTTCPAVQTGIIGYIKPAQGTHRYNWDLFYKHGLTEIPAWIRTHMPSKVWDKTTDPFSNFNGATVSSHTFIMDAFTHPCATPNHARIVTAFLQWPFYKQVLT